MPIFRYISILFILALTPVFAQTAISTLGFSDALIEQLINDGSTTSTGRRPNEITLMPTTAALSEALQARINAINPRSVIETLHLVPNLRGASALALYRAMLNISSLEGLEFFSRSENAVIQLIYEAFFVDSFESRERITLPQAASVAPRFEATLMLNDETFGHTYYQVTIDTAANEMMLITQNLERLRQSVATLAQPNEMIMTIYLIQTNQGLLVYQLIATAANIPGIVRNRAHTSLLNRQAAYQTWVEAIYPR